MSEAETVLYGVPQGSKLGPLLFILFINDLPFNVEHCTLDMYADDTNAAAHGSSLIQTTENIQSDNIEKSLENNRMVVNASKSSVMLVCSHQKRASLLTDRIVLSYNNNTLTQVEEVKVLGLTIDQNLTWKPHIEKTCNKISKLIGLLYRIRPFIDKNCMILYYNSFILPLIDYCLNLWFDAGNVHVHRVQVLQNRIARLILNASHDCSSHDILQRLNWMSVKQRGVYQTCLLMFKVLKCDHPEYLNIFSYQSYNICFKI